MCTPGGVLPMWWVIHMCRGFDPLFSLWQDRARSFWGIFLIHQQQSYLLGYKNYQFFYKNRSFWPQIQFFPRSFWVQFSAASGTPPSVFRPSTPPGMCTTTWSHQASTCILEYHGERFCGIFAQLRYIYLWHLKSTKWFDISYSVICSLRVSHWLIDRKWGF